MIDDAWVGDPGSAEAKETTSFDSIVERYVRDDLDLLVVEGYKGEPLPKIEVARAALSHSLLRAGDPALIAVVSDFDPPGVGVPRFGLDDAAGVADLLASRVAVG